MRAFGSRRTKAREPPGAACPSSCTASGARAVRSGATSTAPRTQPAADTANTVAGDPSARKTPVSAGAASMLRLSIQPVTTFVAVSSAGVRAEPGRERRLGGPRHRERDGRADEEGVDDERVRVGEQGRSHHRAGQRLGDVAGEERRARIAPLRPGGDDGRERRGRDEQQRGDDSGLGDPALVVRVDEHRDPGCELAAVEGRERELHAPERAVPRDGPQDVEQRGAALRAVACPRHGRIISVNWARSLERGERARRTVEPKGYWLRRLRGGP